MLCLSCDMNRSVIELVDCADIYDYEGKYKEEYMIDHSRPKVITQMTAVSLKKNLENTPIGKIDRIIRENPDFEFIFYIDYLDQKDTLYVMELLEKYKCKFPVILDFEVKFQGKNFGPKERYGSTGFICDEKNRVYGVSVIGTDMSFFDKEFLRSKKEIKLKENNREKRPN